MPDTNEIKNTITIDGIRYVAWDHHDAMAQELTGARRAAAQFEDSLLRLRKDGEAHEATRRDDLITALREAGHGDGSISEILDAAGFEGLRKPFRITVRVPVYVELEIDVDAIDEDMAKESVTVDGADDLERQAKEVLRHGGGEVGHDDVKVIDVVQLAS